VKTGHLVFALPMKAAHGYAIEVEPKWLGGGERGRAAAYAVETDQAGNVTKRFGPATNPGVVDACRAGRLEEKPTVDPRG
jgi:hypothetical protein